MPFVIEQSPGLVQERAEFIMHAELSAIRMLQFSASRAGALPEAGPLQLAMNHRTERGESPEGQQVFLVDIDVRAMTGEPESTVFEVKTRFEAEYTLEREFVPSEVQLQAFMDGNAAFHCWPFFREFVLSSTQRMGLTVPPMPMLVLTTGAGRKQGARTRKKR
jgi:hypothetical protein